MTDAGTPGAGDEGRRNNNTRIIAAVVGAIVLVLLLIFLLSRDDDDATVAASSSSGPTTTSTTTTTSSTTTTTAPTTTEATAPPPTIEPARCNPKTSSAKPAEPATAFYDAWRIGDRACAERLGTTDAVDTLFARTPNGPVDEFQGCTEVQDPEPHGDCAFTSPGASTHFKLKFDNTTGWSIFEVYQVAD